MIGLATSISKKYEWDPFDTLDFAKLSKLTPVQLFLDHNLKKNFNAIKKIKKKAQNDKIKLTCHSPVYCNNDILKESLPETLANILENQKEKKVIVHYDETISTKNALDIISMLTTNGLTVALENFYQAYNHSALHKNMMEYEMLILAVLDKGLPVIPVFDIPRFFLDAFQKKYDPIAQTERILKFFKKNQLSPILHLVDYSSFTQKHNFLISVGNGCTPYNQIFNNIIDIGIKIDHIILEFESKDPINQSVMFIRKNLVNHIYKEGK